MATEEDPELTFSQKQTKFIAIDGINPTEKELKTS